MNQDQWEIVFSEVNHIYPEMISFFYDMKHKHLCSVFNAPSVFKGIVHFEIKMWYLSAYPKGIQDVGVFFSSVDPILMFLGQTVLVCQSYNGRYRSLSL